MTPRDLRASLETELWEELLERAPTSSPSTLETYALREAKLLLRGAGVRLDWDSVPGRAVEALLRRAIAELVEEVREVASRRVRDPDGLAAMVAGLLASVPLLEDRSPGPRAPVTAGPGLVRREVEPSPELEEDEAPTALTRSPGFLTRLFRRRQSRPAEEPAPDIKARAKASLGANLARPLYEDGEPVRAPDGSHIHEVAQ
jgi:hypothetical protein